MHEKGQGYTLKFIFEKNSYFEGTELTKSFIMSKPNVIEKCIGTEIKWTQGSDPTKEKKKKKVKKQGGGKKTVTKEVKVDSFFNFFETIELKEEDKKKGKGDDSDEGENDVGEKMDEDFDLGTCLGLDAFQGLDHNFTCGLQVIFAQALHHWQGISKLIWIKGSKLIAAPLLC